MRFAVSSVLYILASQLAAGAAVPETRDIVFETTIHQDESKGTIHQDGSKGTLDHKVLDIMSQKGDYNADGEFYGTLSEQLRE